jgi:hypothetical protein
MALMSLLRCRLASVATLMSLACGGESADVHDITPQMRYRRRPGLLRALRPTARLTT